MKLREFEGKILLSKYLLNLPHSVLIKKSSNNTFSQNSFEKGAVIKAQTFSGKRKAAGGIAITQNTKETEKAIEEIFSKEINGEIINEILVEEKLDIKSEFYISITLDTKTRRPLLVIGSIGGSDIEEVKKKNPFSISYFEINILEGITDKIKKESFEKLGIDDKFKQKYFETIENLFTAFTEYEMRLLEINPLALSDEKLFIADCKADIDDNALVRLKLPFEKTTGYRKKTDRETRANQIDETDHKGVAGKTFIEFDGDIGVLASGGGASIIAMDALISYGAKPANYTEYSGNPPAYKVKRLAEIVMEKENLSGLFVAGGVANFTDIYETLKAVIDVAIEKKVKYPIVIRRGGPNEQKAFEMIKEVAKKNDLNIHIYGRETPITLSAKYMADLSEIYKKDKASQISEEIKIQRGKN